MTQKSEHEEETQISLLDRIYDAYAVFVYEAEKLLTATSDEEIRCALAPLEEKYHKKQLNTYECVAYDRLRTELALRAMVTRARASGAEVYCVSHDCDIKVCSSKHTD